MCVCGRSIRVYVRTFFNLHLIHLPYLNISQSALFNVLFNVKVEEEVSD